jgi:hypothetical protein
MSTEFYRAGVLMIGSLLWDNTKGRKPWREHYFGENFYPNIIDVQVPIRYGRYSTGRKCPTMVFSQDFLKSEKFGVGKFLPFKNHRMTISELISAAKDLSEAEGSTSRNFLKGGKTKKWCIMSYLINNQLTGDKREAILKNWANNYEQELNSDLLDNFKMNSEKESLIDKQGYLRVEWPKSLLSYDLILTTQTKPRKTKDNCSNYLNTLELASEFFEKPEYFIKNKLNGISTADDTEIIGQLKNKELNTFRKNAIDNGCLEIEVNRFIQSFM